MMPKKVSILLSALCLSAAAPTTVLAQEVGDFQLKTETRKNPENTPRPVFPVPSERQMKWNETEFYAFFHYTGRRICRSCKGIFEKFFFSFGHSTDDI